MIPHQVSFGSYKSSVVELRGGINENVSSLELQAGELIDCKNYMIAEGGYGGYLSTAGYERTDGIILPSQYISYVLTIGNCSNAITEGSTVSGDTSGATFIALQDGQVQSGSYIEGDAVVTVQVRVGNGLSLVDSEDITDGASLVYGTLTLALELTGGTSDYNLGIEYARSQVQEVPGEGSVLGLHIFENTVYAFRKHVGTDTVGFFYQDSILGWIEIDTSSDPLTYSAGNHNFNFTNYNFFAGTDSFSMYWTDGVNKARAYDGTVYSTIDNVGMGVNDKPINIIAHNYHLWLAYEGGSLQHSTVGNPNDWTTEAGEIGLGDEITDLSTGLQSSLIIFLREGIRVLSGNIVDNFVLEVFSKRSGAFPKTALRLLGTTFFVDDRGLSTLEAVQEYGDYGANSISQRFKQTLLDSKHTIATTLTHRGYNQYRIFFDDRTAIYVSFEGKEFQGATLMEFNRAISVAAQGEDGEKRDLLVFASDEETGYVYKMDSGTSFDSTPITCRMSTAYYHYGSPRQWKNFKRATIEISGENGQTFDLKVDFDYNELGAPRTIWYNPEIYTVEGGAVYGEGVWGIMKYGVGTAVTNRVPIYLQGVGTNMSYKILSNEAYRPQHIIQNIITDYEMGGRRI